MLARLALGLLLASTSASAQEAGALAEPRPIARVWLRGVGLDPQALAGAVGARLGDKEVLHAGAEAGPITGLVALCHVTLDADGKTLQLEVVLGDGRVYQRQILAPPGDRERAAARLITSTLTAIEDETMTPDRRDGVLDVPAPPPMPDPALPSPPASPPTSPPASAMPVPAPATATPAPATRAAPPSRPPPGQAVAPARPHELGVALALGPLFGLGAPAAGLGLAGGGGGLRLDLRLRSGLALGAGFRGHTGRRDDLVLARLRGALYAGHVARRGAFELAALAGVSLETWQVSRRGTPVTYTVSGPEGAALLLGGLLRLAPGGRISPADRPLSLRIGAYLELAASARSSGRAAQIAATDAQGAQTPRFVLGGAELSLGLELELWFGLVKRGPPAGPHRARRSRPAAP